MRNGPHLDNCDTPDVDALSTLRPSHMRHDSRGLNVPTVQQADSRAICEQFDIPLFHHRNCGHPEMSSPPAVRIYTSATSGPPAVFHYSDRSDFQLLAIPPSKLSVLLRDHLTPDCHTFPVPFCL